MNEAGTDGVNAHVLDVGPEPTTRHAWLEEMWRHRVLLRVLARKDFQTRYKRASFGVLWAVAIPAVQAGVLSAVFSRFVPVDTEVSYGGYVLSGVLPYTYFVQTLSPGSTAIVDSSGLADKVWFPRGILAMVQPVANSVGLVINVVVLLVALPLLGVALTPRLFLLVPACLAMLALTTSLCLVLAALHVYFRDVRFLVQGVVTMLFFITPVAYPLSAVGRLRPVLEVNPLTGVLTLFRMATVGTADPWIVPVCISLGFTLVLILIAVEIYRVHERLFVDLL